MNVDLTNLSLVNNEQAGRLETLVGEHTAYIAYRRAGKQLIFIHTEVPPALEGHGIAARLTRAALYVARSTNFKVVPFCPYTSGYIRKHREYLDLPSAEDRHDLLSN